MAKLTLPLTNIQIQNAKPKDKAYRLLDGDGLYVDIMPSGVKVWRVKYQHPTKRNAKGRRVENTYTIGNYPKITLRDARKTCIEVKELIERGIDPNTHKKRAKQRVGLNSNTLFESLAHEWHTKNLSRWDEKHAVRIIRSLELDVFPYIGEMCISDIEPTDVLAILRRIESREALNYISKIRQRIGAIFRYAVAIGVIKYNPIPDLREATTVYKVKHFAALKIEDLAPFLRTLQQDPSEILKKAILFTLLTFVRSGEVRGARWSEIHWESKEWHIPAERMKMKRPHVVPLSTQVLRLLEELKPFTSDSEYLFYTRRKTQKISENAMLQVLRRIGWKDRTTIHGFRALASSTLYDAGFRSEAIELQLAHAETNAVKAAYNHMARFMSERVQIMQWWGDLVEAKQQGAQVIPFRLVSNH